MSFDKDARDLNMHREEGLTVDMADPSSVRRETAHSSSSLSDTLRCFLDDLNNRQGEGVEILAGGDMGRPLYARGSSLNLNTESNNNMDSEWEADLWPLKSNDKPLLNPSTFPMPANSTTKVNDLLQGVPTSPSQTFNPQMPQTTSIQTEHANFQPHQHPLKTESPLNTAPLDADMPKLSGIHPNPTCVHCDTPVRPAGRNVPDSAIRFTCHSCKQMNARESCKPPRKPDRGKGWNQRNGDKYEFVPVAWDMHGKVIQARCKFCATAYRSTFGVSGLNKHIQTPHHKYNLDQFTTGASLPTSRSNSSSSCSSGSSRSNSLSPKNGDGRSVISARSQVEASTGPSVEAVNGFSMPRPSEPHNYTSSDSIQSSEMQSMSPSVGSSFLDERDHSVQLRPWRLPKTGFFMTHVGQLVQIQGSGFSIRPVVSGQVEPGVVGIAVAAQETVEGDPSCACIVDGRVTVVHPELSKIAELRETRMPGLFVVVVKGFSIGITSSAAAGGAMLVFLQPRGVDSCFAVFPDAPIGPAGGGKKRKWFEGADRAYPFPKAKVSEDIQPGDLVAVVDGNAVRRLDALGTLDRERVQHVLVCATFPDNPAGEVYPGGKSGSPWCTCAVVGMTPVRVPGHGGGAVSRLRGDGSAVAVDLAQGELVRMKHEARGDKNTVLVGTLQLVYPQEYPVDQSTHVLVFVNFNPDAAARMGLVEAKVEDHESRILTLETSMMNRSNEDAMDWQCVPFSRTSQPLSLRRRFEQGTRDWAMTAVRQWIASPHWTKAFCLVGLAGVGKSVFAAELACRGSVELRELCNSTSSEDAQNAVSTSTTDSQSPENSIDSANAVPIAAYHFFRHDDNDLAKASMCARSLNEQLCNNVPGFLAVWESQRLRLTPEVVSSWGTLDWFRRLIFDPANELKTSTTRVVIVLDALDECGDSASVAKLLSHEWFVSAPDWLGVFATGRPELFNVSAKNRSITVLHTADSRNIRDVRMCLERRVAVVVSKEYRESVVADLVKKSDGLFLYVRFVGEILQEALRAKRKRVGAATAVEPEDLPPFPVGLGGVYEEFFGRLKRVLGENYSRLLAPVAAARAPLPRYLWLRSLGLETASGTRDTLSMAKRLEQRCHNLLSFDNNQVRFVHKSMREWLTDTSWNSPCAMNCGDPALAVDPTNWGHQNIALICHQMWHDCRFGDAVKTRQPRGSPRGQGKEVMRNDPKPGSTGPFEDQQVTQYIGQQLFFHLCKSNLFLVAGAMLVDLDQLLRRLRLEVDPANIRRDALELFVEEINERMSLERLEAAISATSATSPSPARVRFTLEHLKRMADDVDKITRVIFLASEALQRDEREIASQLLGYMLPTASTSKWTLRLLKQCRTYRPGACWWRPLLPTLHDDKLLLRVLKGTRSVVTALRFANDGESLIAGTASGVIRVWQTVGFRQQTVHAHRGPVTALAVTNDGRVAVSASVDWTVRLTDLHAPRSTGMLDGHEDSVLALALSAKGRVLATGSGDKSIRVWDPENQRCLVTLRGHDDAVTALAFSQDGDALWSGSLDGKARLWRWKQQECLAVLPHKGRIVGIGFLHENESSSAVYVGSGSTVVIWAVEAGKLPRRLRRMEVGCPVADLAVNDSGKYMVWVSGVDNLVRLWRCSDLVGAGSATSIAPFTVSSPTPQPLRCVGISGGHTTYIAAGSSANTILLWLAESVVESGARSSPTSLSAERLEEDKMVKKLFGDPRVVATSSLTLLSKQVRVNPRTARHTVLTAAMSPDSRWIATGSDNGAVYLWNAVTGKVVCASLGHEKAVRALAFSHDSELLASGSDDKTIRVFYLAKGRECGNPLMHLSAVTALAFSSTARLAVGLFDGRIRQWNFKLCRIGRIARGNAFKAHSSLVRAVAYSPGGNTVASCSFDFSIRLWSAATGQSVQEVVPAYQGVSCLNFTPSGEALIAMVEGGVENEDVENSDPESLGIGQVMVFKVTGADSKSPQLQRTTVSKFLGQGGYARGTEAFVNFLPEHVAIPLKVKQPGSIQVPGDSNGVGFTLGYGDPKMSFMVAHVPQRSNGLCCHGQSDSKYLRAYILAETQLHILELVRETHTGATKDHDLSDSGENLFASLSISHDTSLSDPVAQVVKEDKEELPIQAAVGVSPAFWEVEGVTREHELASVPHDEDKKRKTLKLMKKQATAVYNWCTGSQWRSAMYRQVFGRTLESGRAEVEDEEVVRDCAKSISVEEICAKLASSMAGGESLRIFPLLEACELVSSFLPKLNRTLYFAKVHLIGNIHQLRALSKEQVPEDSWEILTVDDVIDLLADNHKTVSSLVISAMKQVEVFRRILEGFARDSSLNTSQVCANVYQHALAMNHSSSMQQLFTQALKDVIDRKTLMAEMGLGNLSLEKQCIKLDIWSSQVKVVEKQFHPTLLEILQ